MKGRRHSNILKRITAGSVANLDLSMPTSLQARCLSLCTKLDRLGYFLVLLHQLPLFSFSSIGIRRNLSQSGLSKSLIISPGKEKILNNKGFFSRYNNNFRDHIVDATPCASISAISTILCFYILLP